MFHGNKRAALASALVFLALNGGEFAQDDDGFEHLTLHVAKGAMGKEQVAKALRKAKTA